MSDHLILRVHVKLDPTDISSIHTSAGNVAMLPFSGHATGTLFNGEVAPGGVDTQTTDLAGVRHMSARYLLRGYDFTGAACGIYVENEAWFSGGKVPDPFPTVPTMRTDSAALAPYLHQNRFRGEGANAEGGVIISIYDTREDGRPALSEPARATREMPAQAELSAQPTLPAQPGLPAQPTLPAQPSLPAQKEAPLLSPSSPDGQKGVSPTSIHGQKGVSPLSTAGLRALPRTVITTDGEVDDQNSVIRALLYASDMDVAGIVLTSSKYHYAGDPARGIEPFRWTGTQWLFDFIDAYAEVLDNLLVHNPNYPSAEYLKQVTKIGNISMRGEMDEVTEGSEFLKELFLDDDPRTLYVQTWGGTNTTARALKSIEEEYAGTGAWPAIRQKVLDKLVLYIILDQDESYGAYIAKAWPELRVLNDTSNFWHFAYAWQLHPDALNTTLHADWCFKNLVDHKGPLMDRYALMGDGKWLKGEDPSEQRGTWEYLEKNPEYERFDFISEGDSPSFLYLVDRGLRALEDPSYGGWGGRFDAAGRNTVGDYDPHAEQFEASYTLTRWFDDIQNDFAARVDWCLAPTFAEANHVPSLRIEEGVDVSARAGETVSLTAVGSDPDGDELSYRWWRYFEADTYGKAAPALVDDDSLGLLLDRTAEVDDPSPFDTIALDGAQSPQVSFVVPADAQPGDTIHLIAEVADSGAHHLKAYQRVIVTVS